MRELLISLVLLGLFSCTLAERQKRIGIFEVVKFANDLCGATNGKNGTCFTEDECESRNGAAEGECAEGYGVCCVFSLECGGMRKENCTYFESTASFEGPCMATVCKMNDDIAQLRLDFERFVIGGPTATSADGTGLKAINGATSAGGEDGAQVRICQDDQFSVTSPGSVGSPVICGTNTDSHMYIDASEQCNALNFKISSGTAPEWRIKIMQYSKDFGNKAPSGCLQYFFGAATGTIKSFNFDGGEHLSDQNQLFCVRRESNQCQICWTAAADDFHVSGMSPPDAASASGHVGKSNNAGGYGADGKGTNFDHVRIPSATKAADGAYIAGNADGFAGHTFATETATGKGTATVCSRSLPFRLRFRTDGAEASAESKLAEKGIKMSYEQKTC